MGFRIDMRMAGAAVIAAGLALTSLGGLGQAYSRPAAELTREAREAFLRGTADIQAGKYQEAVGEFQKVLELDKQFAPAYLNLGLAYHSLRAHEKSISSLQKALQLDERLDSAALFLGINYLEIDLPEKAIEPLQRARALKPSDPDVHLWLGKAFLANGRFKEAIPCLERALDADPQDLGIQYGLARAHLLISEQMLTDISKKSPHSYYAHYIMGQSLKALGKLDLAITEFKLVIQSNPTLLGVHDALGDVYYQHMEYDKALEEFKQEFLLNPYNYTAACKMYDILIKQGKSDEVIAPLERINRERPSLSCSDYELGRAWMRKRDFEKALTYLQETVAALPDYEPAYNLLGEVYTRLGREAEAQAAFQKSKALAQRSFPASEVLPAKDSLSW